jgi:hypothetical protein
MCGEPTNLPESEKDFFPLCEKCLPVHHKNIEQMYPECFDDKEIGLYRKFNVSRVDGSSEPGGKHENCSYFVLDLYHDKFSIPALRAYAKACQVEYPELAKDIHEMLEHMGSV